MQSGMRGDRVCVFLKKIVIRKKNLPSERTPSNPCPVLSKGGGEIDECNKIFEGSFSWARRYQILFEAGRIIILFPRSLNRIMFLFGDFKAKELGKVERGWCKKSTNVTVRNCSKKVSFEQLYISKKLILMTLRFYWTFLAPRKKYIFGWRISIQGIVEGEKLKRGKSSSVRAGLKTLIERKRREFRNWNFPLSFFSFFKWNLEMNCGFAP